MTDQKHTTNYQSHTYNYQSRWVSYFTQVDAVLAKNPKTVLEVGVGDGVVCDYLKKRGVAVTTADVDSALKPDTVASVTRLPFPTGAFDVVLCAEVLEHLPFEEFPRALGELRRVARSFVVVSVPHWGPTVHVVVRLPLLGRFQLFWKVPYPKRHTKEGEHFWEIGKLGYAFGRIRRTIKEAGFRIEHDFIVPESPYHHFFILKKASL